MRNKHYFPMFVDLSNKKIVVVGGGSAATRRVQTLLSFNRNVIVVAPMMTRPLLELGKLGYIEARIRPAKRSDLTDAYMVIAATNDRKLNDEIYRICKEQGSYINVVNDREKSDFSFPNVLLKQEFVVGISANGVENKRVSRVCQEVQKVLGDIPETVETDN